MNLLPIKKNQNVKKIGQINKIYHPQCTHAKISTHSILHWTRVVEEIKPHLNQKNIMFMNYFMCGCFCCCNYLFKKVLLLPVLMFVTVQILIFGCIFCEGNVLVATDYLNNEAMTSIHKYKSLFRACLGMRSRSCF